MLIRPIRLLVLLTLTTLLAACALFRGGPELARVLVFNIHAGKDAAGAPNLDAVAALITERAADLVLLQEVDRNTGRSGGVDQVARLRELTSYDGAFGRSLIYDGGEYGIAALARNSIRTHLTEPLLVFPAPPRAGGAYEPRVAMTLTAATPLGRIQAINTHLDASADEAVRLQESFEITLLVKRLANRAVPLVVGGDFNAPPGSATYQRLIDAGVRDAWTECGSGDGFTYPADAPARRIDYLFLTEGMRCTAAEVIDTRISDHRPLLVTLTR